MKVLLISLYPPTRHNIGGPSSLPYYLAKDRPADVSIDLFYYEGFENRKNLFIGDLHTVFQQVTCIRRTPAWKYYPLRLLQELPIKALQGISLKHLPRAGDLKKAINGQYDLIWIYTGLLYPWAKALRTHTQVMTGPDNLLLHHRLVASLYTQRNRQVPGNISAGMAKKQAAFALHRERRWAGSATLLHVVGEDDKRVYDELGAASHAFFSPHPYYEYLPIAETIDAAGEKLTVLVAGANTSIYTGNYFDEVVQLLTSEQQFATRYKFVVTGKGFEAGVSQLQQAGYEVTHHHWVASYEATLAACHIQFFPIILGTGTKGKVLCALATGLLCIGSHFAFENILIDPGEDVVQLDNEDAYGVLDALQRIDEDRQGYAAKAKKAADKVRDLHAPARTAALFWKKVQAFWKIQQGKHAHPAT